MSRTSSLSIAALVFCSLSFLGEGALAATLTVNPAGGTGVYKTLNSAVTAAASGDTIEMAPGTYTSTQVDTKGKSLTITSTGGAATTTLVGKGTLPVITVPSGSVTLVGLSFTNPNARGVRGTGGNVTLTNVVMTGLGSTALNGGAVHMASGNLTVSGSTFNNNIGAYGGHIHVQGGAVLNVTSSTFDGGRATRGGGLSVSTATLTMTNSTLSSNVATDWGGAIRSTVASTVTLDNCAFSGNSATNQEGGAISSAGGGTLVISESSFSDNTAGLNGGAIYFEEGSFSVTSSLFEFNEALTGSGGGIYMLEVSVPSDIEVTGTTFTSNLATVAGGGIFVQDLGATLRGNAFALNSAGQGGAVFAEDTLGGSGALQVVGNTFMQNTGSSGAGALFADSVRNTLVLGNRFTDSSAPQGAAAELACRDTAVFGNNIVAYHGGGAALYTREETGCDVLDVGYNGWFSNAGGDTDGTPAAADVNGNGNLPAVDPLFVYFTDNSDPTDDDISLDTLSPYIDAGSPWFVDLDGTRADMGGN